MAPDITYFDPVHEKRVDGLAAIKEMLGPITGKISVSRYDWSFIKPELKQPVTEEAGSPKPKAE
jgi:hypothetical protein